MPFGDPQGTFAGTGGYGGQFPGFGGASAGYTGGYGNPSSVGGGTAGQTYAGRAYANTLNKHNPTLANYSGTTRSVSGPSGSGGVWLGSAKKKNVTPAQQAEIQAKIKANKAASDAYDLAQEEPPVPGSNLTPSGTVSPSQGYWGSGPGPIYGGPPVPGGRSSFSSGIHQNSASSGWAGGYGDKGADSWGNAYGNYGASPALGGDMLGGGSWNVRGRQFGGPVAPGGQYTVGENGPETLQMSPGGGGQVIPNNPADAAAGGFPGGGGVPQPMPSNNQPLGGMNPQLMQQMFQLIRQNPQLMQRVQQMRQGGGGMQRPAGQMPPAMSPSPIHGFAGDQMGGGGMQRPSGQMPPAGMPTHGLAPPSRVGGGGLQRPPSQMGFGGSGLGQSGVLGQLRSRLGGGGSMYRGG